MKKPLRPVAADGSFVELPAADHPVAHAFPGFPARGMDEERTEGNEFLSVLPDKIEFTFQGEPVFPSDDPFPVFRHFVFPCWNV